MPGQLPISLLSALAWGQLSYALVPADPTITSPAILPRQNDDRFIGWVEASGTWYSEQCNAGLTWYQDGKYAQCCAATLASCYAPTACVDGSLIYPYSDMSSTTTIGCVENFGNSAWTICNTAFIFENFGDSNPKTDIVCGPSSVNWSYYRKIPASATEPIISSDLPSSALDDVTSIPLAASPSASANSENQENEENEESSGSSSKAWIAGAVVGPIAGLAIIGAGIFFCLRRKKKNNAAQPGPGAPGAAPAGVAVGGQQGYTDAKPQMAAAPQPGYAQPMGSPGYANGNAYNQFQQPGSPQDQYNQFGQQQQQQQPPLSPAPQYTAPYNPSGSPPPQGHYAPDQKQTFQHSAEPSHPQASELGGSSMPTTGSHTAELSGESSGR